MEENVVKYLLCFMSEGRSITTQTVFLSRPLEQAKNLKTYLKNYEKYSKYLYAY